MEFIKSKLQGDGIRKLAMRGAAWTMVASVGQQWIRLASNLVLTRLLVPEAFGIMAVVNSVQMGVNLLSDVGVDQSIIRSPRAEERDFSNTAWTVQVVRGLCLSTLVAILAVPASEFFNEPMLKPILPVVGFTAAIKGLRPTKVLFARRRVSLGKLTIITLSAQLLSIVSMVVLAWFWRSVWALVIGGVVNAIALTALQYAYLPGRRDGFSWDKGAVDELVGFGKWIFLGTAASYLTGKGMSLIQGKLVSMSTLGLISVAANLAWALGQVTSNLEQHVLFPVYSQLQTLEVDEFRRKVTRARTMVLRLVLPGFAVFMVGGPLIIDVLYDDRYAMAGRYLQIISASSALGVVMMQYGSALFAQGNSKGITLSTIVQAVLRIAGCIIGYEMGGDVGMLLGTCAGTLACYPMFAFVAKGSRIWQPKLDFICLSLILFMLWLTITFIPAGA